MSFCGSNESCSNWISRNSPNFRFTSRQSLGSGTFPQGFNRYQFSQRILVTRGCLIGITHYQNTLAVETNDPLTISDYFIRGSTSFKINATQNWRFYLRAIQNTSYNSIRVPRSLTASDISTNSFQINNINASLLISSTSVSRDYNITNCKFIFI